MVDAKREQTMRDRLGDRASQLVNNSQFLPLVRNRQKLTTTEEFEAIISLAEHAKSPQNYFMVILSKKNFERTLDYARRILERSIEQMRYVAEKLSNKSKAFMNFVGDKLAQGSYSMKTTVDMVDYALKKNNPDRYFIGILKKGYRSNV